MPKKSLASVISLPQSFITAVESLLNMKSESFTEAEKAEVEAEYILENSRIEALADDTEKTLAYRELGTLEEYTAQALADRNEALAEVDGFGTTLSIVDVMLKTAVSHLQTVQSNTEDKAKSRVLDFAKKQMGKSGQTLSEDQMALILKALEV